jgi:CHAT domain-containing protein
LWERRLVTARLSGAEWRTRSPDPKPVETCSDRLETREQALNLLVVARGDCLDTAIREIGQLAPEDLAAAYLVRAERDDWNPADVLQALKTARGFNRALALEYLQFTNDAMAQWDGVVAEGSGWSREARTHRDTLAKKIDPTKQWTAKLETALNRQDRAALEIIARTFPSETYEYFELHLDSDSDRPLAEALAKAGDPYALAVVETMERTPDRRGIEAFEKKEYEKAATLLERVGNPLYLRARHEVARGKFGAAKRSEPPEVPDAYRDLAARIHTLRANALEYEDRYLEAHSAYEDALRLAASNATRKAAILSRRSENYTLLGLPERGLRDALEAVRLLERVVDVRTRYLSYGAAATAAEQLGFPETALLYQNAGVESTPKGSVERAVALRRRAEIFVALGRDVHAARDLTEASVLARAMANESERLLMQMRLNEGHGMVLLKRTPRESIGFFTDAIALAEKQDSSYRAALHVKRSFARRSAGDPRAIDDTVKALSILRGEAKGLVDAAERGRYEELWNAYFSRFDEVRRQLILDLILKDDLEGAFILAEQARAFEPMQLLLRLKGVPGFQPIETADDLQRHLSNLPEDTVILQYLVLPDRTYAWILVRGKIDIVQTGRGHATIENRVTGVARAIDARIRTTFNNAMRAVYDELFRTPLSQDIAVSKTRLVIIPDGPMHGLPFAGLQPSKDTYLIDRASIATAGSTSLYLYALERDRQFRAGSRPSVLLVGNPTLHPDASLRSLTYAEEEVKELQRHYYPGAQRLVGAEATIDRFLKNARTSTIIHFAGHAIANPHRPWQSRLMLAPGPNDSGELTAERLMGELSELDGTRLVVLGACTTAGGNPVGPQGLAPLVRPLIAANVPGVVGTLWDVGDATAKDLLVSLHCHHRRGDDVAVALQKAQLERLRDTNPMEWAAFQVVGYAGSPYERPPASEETTIDRVCTEDFLHRPAGLHSQ